MSSFTDVTVAKNANIYFDGRVTSRTITFADGSTKTLGIMLPGEYEFGTDKKEIIEVLAGELQVLLPGKDEWQSFKEGESFEIAGSSRFQLKVNQLLDYCCSFVD